MKDEFLAVVSHDLRTPLTSILGWASILSTGKVDEAKTRRGIDTIQRNARAQARLIDDILDVARIISGKMRIELEPTDVQSVVQASVDAIRPQAAAKELAFAVSLEPVPPTLADSERLGQVVSNLLSNAIRFTPHGRTVELRLRADGDEIVIEVCDSGRGIAPELLPHVFDRFRPEGLATQGDRHGLGLALTIVRHIVELHEGTVSAESSGVGLGSRFVVRLPIRAGVTLEQSTISVVAQKVRAAPLHPLGGVRVLLVDDDADSGEFLTQVLGSAGAEVVVAPSSQAAFALFENSRPHVLLSDIELPEMDGYAFIREIRKRPAEQGGTVPAAALTAYARPQDASAALRAGFDLHVAKPIEPFEVVNIVFDLARLPPRC